MLLPVFYFIVPIIGYLATCWNECSDFRYLVPEHSVAILSLVKTHALHTKKFKTKFKTEQAYQLNIRQV